MGKLKQNYSQLLKHGLNRTLYNSLVFQAIHRIHQIFMERREENNRAFLLITFERVPYILLFELLVLLFRVWQHLTCASRLIQSP